MANDNNSNEYLYLLDAKNARQYRVHLSDKGDPTAEIDVLGREGLKANETVFAFDELEKDTLTQSGTGNELFLNTIMYQMDTNAAAKISGFAYVPVSYKITLENDAKNGKALVYELTAQSAKDMEAVGLTTDGAPAGYRIPVKFDGAINALELATQMPFPPHQQDGGFGVHFAFDTPSQHNPFQDIINQLFNTTEGAPKVVNTTGDFNKTTNPTPKKRADYKIPDATVESLLKQFCKDLTADAAEGRLDPVIGRDEETDRALKVMTRRKQSSLCFTGEAGVGKSAMFAAVAQRIVDDTTLPESLRNARVLELDLQKMNAGTSLRGQFEERLKPLIDGLQEREGILNGRKIIIAIDEIHSQLTSGGAIGASDAGNMMKPFLTGKGISVMGTTTDEEYKKYIEKDAALGRRFEKLRLHPPNEADTVAIIKRLWSLTKEANHLTQDLTDEEFRYIVTMTNRYAPQEAQPSKAEKVMNTAAASAEFAGRTEIAREDILAAVAQMSNLPLSFLNQSDSERFLKLETALPEEVLGQPGLSRIVDGLIGARAGLTDENQPWGCFVLQGPTGTGKTETAKSLARYLFGTEDAIIKLDMAEYSEKFSVARLIGAPPGYVGFEDAEPALTERIRNQPYSILLLDEIEKAHPDVFNTLLPILNDGKMKDNHGKTVLFNNVIVLMTTNAGAQTAMKLIQGKGSSGIGFDTPAAQDTVSPEQKMEKLAEVYKKAITVPLGEGRGSLFRPEMINRIEELGGFITYIPLDPQVVSNLVIRELNKINVRLNSQAGANVKDVTLEVSQDVMDQLAKEGYDPAMGARPLRKVVREKISNQFGKWLMGHKEELEAFVAKNGATKIIVDSVDNFAPQMQAVAEVAVAATNDNIVSVGSAKKKLKKPKLEM